MNCLKKFFLNEKFILCVIVLNGIIIFLQESGYSTPTLGVVDVACTLIFIIEMLVKQKEYGIKGYWSEGWNRLDGTLVILSIPSIIALFVPTSVMLQQLDVLLVLRILRVIRFMRVLHVFPNFGVIMKNFHRALKESYGIFVGLFIIIIIIALISCSLFKDSAPSLFGTPMDSIYSIFRICTGEGWNEIPDTIAENSTVITARFVRLYFSAVLIFCCVIGLSLVNSIFVDAMVSDNDKDEDVKKELEDIEKKLDSIIDNSKK